MRNIRDFQGAQNISIISRQFPVMVRHHMVVIHSKPFSRATVNRLRIKIILGLLVMKKIQKDLVKFIVVFAVAGDKRVVLVKLLQKHRHVIIIKNIGGLFW